jgi:Zn finger protein HypA/HybF involved in hydrogenase expression
MILPIFICRTCGKFGGMGLAMSQDFARATRGEKLEKEKAYPPECPLGHGRMYEVQDGDRLSVLPAVVEAEQITEKVESTNE